MLTNGLIILSIIPDFNWKPIEKPLYGWVRTIERIICSQRPPEMSGPIVNIFSDYSGDSKKSNYHVISVLYLDVHASANWELRRRIVRQRYLGDGRRISFKSLGDRQRQQALVPFLQAANEIEGICITLIIRKSIKVLCSNEKVFAFLQDNLAFESKWKQQQFENMLRVTHLVSVLIAGLSKPGQHIYWISDEDALMANLARSRDLGQMLSRFTSYYVKQQLGELGVGTTSIDEGDRYEEDLAAIPDLAAGALAEISTRLSSEAGGVMRTGLMIPFYGSFSAKTELISSWLADGGQRLKRVAILFEKFEEKAVSVSRFNIG